MAGLLRIYRRFYRINVVDPQDQYTLIDPYSLTASVRNISQGSVIVEASATTVNTGVGVYYADLSVPLYTSDDEYEIDWQVTYTASAPLRHLYTRFRYPEIDSNSGSVIRELDLELINEPSLDVSVEKYTLDYTVEPNTP